MRPSPEYLTSRVELIDQRRTAYIMYEDKPIATITEEYSTISGESDWVIAPIWETCDWFEKQGIVLSISGIDLSLRKKEYVRRFVPYFVTQRVISERREDCRELLDKLHLNTYDIFEILCRSHGVCGDDIYYVSRTPDLVIDASADIFPYDIPEEGWS